MKSIRFGQSVFTMNKHCCKSKGNGRVLNFVALEFAPGLGSHGNLPSQKQFYLGCRCTPNAVVDKLHQLIECKLFPQNHHFPALYCNQDQDNGCGQ